MTKSCIDAVLLGNLLKNHIASEIVTILATSNVSLSLLGMCSFKLLVYGSTKEELIENRKRCRDAANVFGVALRSCKLFKSGETIRAVEFERDPFHQIKHYMSEMVVTYHEA